MKRIICKYAWQIFLIMLLSGLFTNPLNGQGLDLLDGRITIPGVSYRTFTAYIEENRLVLIPTGRWQDHRVSVQLDEMRAYADSRRKGKIFIECMSEEDCILRERRNQDTGERWRKYGKSGMYKQIDFDINTYMMGDDISVTVTIHRIIEYLNGLNPRHKGLSVAEISGHNAWLEEAVEQSLVQGPNSKPFKEVLKWQGYLMDLEIDEKSTVKAVYFEEGKGVYYHNSASNETIMLTGQKPAMSGETRHRRDVYRNRRWEGHLYHIKRFHVYKNEDWFMFLTEGGEWIRFNTTNGQLSKEQLPLTIAQAEFGPNGRYAITYDGENTTVYDLQEKRIIDRLKTAPNYVYIDKSGKIYTVQNNRNPSKVKRYALLNGKRQRSIPSSEENKFKPETFPQQFIYEHSFNFKEWLRFNVSSQPSNFPWLLLQMLNHVDNKSSILLASNILYHNLRFATSPDSLVFAIIGQSNPTTGPTQVSILIPNELEAYLENVFANTIQSNYFATGNSVTGLELVYHLDSVMANTIQSGCLAGDCVNGFGTWHYGDGRIYEGQMLHLKPHGEGIMFKDGFFFRGQFHQGQMHGRYDVRDRSGTDLGYLDFVNGRMLGVCKGEFESCYNGWGTLVVDDKGTTYEGRFSDGFPVGYVLVTRDGETKEEFYVRPDFNGRMGFRKHDGKVEYRIYEKGKLYAICIDDCRLPGRGMIRLSSGGIYSGDLDINGKPHGQGTFSHRNIRVKGRWSIGIVRDAEVTYNNSRTSFKGEVNVDFTPRKGTLTFYENGAKMTWCCTYDSQGRPDGVGKLRKYIVGTGDYNWIKVTMKAGQEVK